MTLADSPRRQTVTRTTTTVRHVVNVWGPNRENPPSLGQLREFVEACEGLPDDTKVTLDRGHLDEGGRHSYTFSVSVLDAESKT